MAAGRALWAGPAAAASEMTGLAAGPGRGRGRRSAVTGPLLATYAACCSPTPAVPALARGATASCRCCSRRRDGVGRRRPAWPARALRRDADRGPASGWRRRAPRWRAARPTGWSTVPGLAGEPYRDGERWPDAARSPLADSGGAVAALAARPQPGGGAAPRPGCSPPALWPPVRRVRAGMASAADPKYVVASPAPARPPRPGRAELIGRGLEGACPARPKNPGCGPSGWQIRRR